MSAFSFFSTAKFVGPICAMAMLLNDAYGQEKIDVRVKQDVISKGTSRVIVALRKPTASDHATLAASQPQQYLSIALDGTNTSNVDRIADLPLAVAEVPAPALDILKSDPNVLFVVKDEPVQAALFDTDIIVGAKSAWNVGFTGKNQVIAILDSGIDRSHQAFGDKIVGEACFSTPSSNVYKVSSLCPNKIDVMVMTGAAAACDSNILGCDHGTHVAGIAAGSQMYSGSNIFSGVASGAKIYPIQVFSRFDDVSICGPKVPCIRSFPSDQIKALAHVRSIVENHRIASVNLSVGGGYHTAYCDSTNTVYAESIEKLYQMNVPVVIAAGNDHHYNAVSEPACFYNAITVTATTKPTSSNDEGIDVGYANNSAGVDLAAPGSNVMSAIIGGTGVKSGTSMAAPHVAGAWAIMKEAIPDATVEEIRSLLIATGKPITDIRNGIKVSRLDLSAAIAHMVSRPTSASSSQPSVSGIGGLGAGIPAGTKSIVVVPGLGTGTQGLAAEEVESKLNNAKSAAPNSRVIVREEAFGDKKGYVIESPGGIQEEAIRDVFGSGSSVFSNSPKRLPFKE